MSMVRILILLMGLVAVALAAKYALEGTTGPAGSAVTEPARQLDNVRVKAKEFEAAQQKSADRAEVPP
jgi:hypothetical protein